MIVIYYIAALILAAVDQVSKKLIVRAFPNGEDLKLIQAGDTDILTLTYRKNTGAAFSSLEGQTAFLITVTLLMMAALTVWLIRTKPKSKVPFICTAMILGGGIGNLIDRIALGYVVDFIILFPFDFVFNFADICVVFGAIILMIYYIFFENREHPQKSETAEQSDE